MRRKEKLISDECWDDGAGNDRSDNEGILRLGDNVIVQSVERRDGSEGESRGHQQGIVPFFLVIFPEVADGWIQAGYFGGHLSSQKNQKQSWSRHECRNRYKGAGSQEIQRR